MDKFIFYEAAPVAVVLEKDPIRSRSDPEAKRIRVSDCIDPSITDPWLLINYRRVDETTQWARYVLTNGKKIICLRASGQWIRPDGTVKEYVYKDDEKEMYGEDYKRGPTLSEVRLWLQSNDS